MAEETVDRVHRDLKIIATLREGDKVYVADGALCVLHPSPYNATWRWLRGDNRVKSLATVQSTMMDALAVAEYSIERVMHRQTQSPPGHPGLRDTASHTTESTVRRLYRELQSAIVGLKCLRITYAGDHSTTAKIDVLREGVVERLDGIAEWLRATGNADPDAQPHRPPERRGLLAIESFAGCILLSEEDLRC
jgi:hypothetical protein